MSIDMSTVGQQLKVVVVGRSIKKIDDDPPNKLWGFVKNKKKKTLLFYF